MRDFHVGDIVMYFGGIYEVTRKRMGVDMYEIAKVHRLGRDRFLTNVHDGIYADQLQMAEEVEL